MPLSEHETSLTVLICLLNLTVEGVDGEGGSGDDDEDDDGRRTLGELEIEAEDLHKFDETLGENIGEFKIATDMLFNFVCSWLCVS